MFKWGTGVISVFVFWSGQGKCYCNWQLTVASAEHVHVHCRQSQCAGERCTVHAMKFATETFLSTRLKKCLCVVFTWHGFVLVIRGSPLTRRMKEREKEKEADTRDRQREKEEIDELKRKLLDQGHPDPEAELARVSSCWKHSKAVDGTICSSRNVCLLFFVAVCRALVDWTGPKKASYLLIPIFKVFVASVSSFAVVDWV